MASIFISHILITQNYVFHCDHFIYSHHILWSYSMPTISSPSSSISTPLLLLNRHLSQVIPLSLLLTRSILDSLMPQTDEDFTRTVDLNALSSLKSPIQTYSHMPVSRWLRQGDGDFDANLGYKVIPLFKRQKRNERIQLRAVDFRPTPISLMEKTVC